MEQPNEVKILSAELEEKRFQHKEVYVDPYRFFYDLYKEEEELECHVDEYKVVDADPKAIRAHFKEQIDEARKVRSSWLAKAMEEDPAFMLDPVNDYYKKLIKPEYLNKMNDQQIDDVISIYDPVTWARKNLLTKRPQGWSPRCSKKGIPYQEQLIRCKSRKMVVRAGRRIGKTAALVVRLLHRSFTWFPKESSVYDIIIFTPNQAQIDLIFKMMEVFIDGNPKLLALIKENGKIPTRKNPYHMLEFHNGVTIKGFVSGSTAIRGQRADMLVLDEGSFLTKEDTDAVVALLAENKNVEQWISSTPKGLKDYFYERVHDESFVSFYFPTDKYHPDWDYEMEQTFRNQLTDSGYRHEVLADFSADGEGVFQTEFIEMAKRDYQYADCKPHEGCIYAIGVDWNDVQNGTQIYVIEYSMLNSMFRIVDRASVSVAGFTQTMAVNKIRDLNRKWRANVLYVDYGHGSTQVELLHILGMKAQPNSVDKRLLKAKAINFSSVFEIRDPWTKQKVKKPGKPYIVNNAVRVLESGFLEISKYDKLLIQQMEGYHIHHISPKGLPVYEPDEKVGDHCLDALMLALLGFHLEYSSLAKPKMAQSMSLIDSHPLNRNSQHQTEDFGLKEAFEAVMEADARLQADKEYERKILKEAHGTSRSAISPDNTTIKRRTPQSGRFTRRHLPQRSSRSKF